MALFALVKGRFTRAQPIAAHAPSASRASTSGGSPANSGYCASSSMSGACEVGWEWGGIGIMEKEARETA